MVVSGESGLGEGEAYAAVPSAVVRNGDHPQEYLTALVGESGRSAGESGRSAVVIANALDDARAAVRRSGVEDELAALAGLGFDAVGWTCVTTSATSSAFVVIWAGSAWPGCGAAMCSCSAMRCSAAAGMSYSGICSPRTRWSMPGTAPGRAYCPRACEASRPSMTLPRSRGSTAQNQCGTAWVCWTRVRPALPVTGAPRDGRDRARRGAVRR